MIAVERNGEALRDVPEHLRAKGLCYIAVAQDGEALRDVPEALRTLELCRIAVEQNLNAYKHVPFEHYHLLKRLVPPPTATVAWRPTLLDELAEFLKASPCAIDQEHRPT